MGTRSTTKMYDEDRLLLSLYKQWDGYTEDWGECLKSFIKSGNFVNGYTQSKEKQFNGMGCFALQLVAKFKDGVGDLYATTEDDTQEYNYTITKKGNKIIIECQEEPNFKEVIEVIE